MTVYVLTCVFTCMLVSSTVAAESLVSGEKAITADVIAEKVYVLTHGLRVKQAVSQRTNGKVATLINRLAGKRPVITTFDSFTNNEFTDGVTESKSLTIFKSGKQKGTGILMTSYLDSKKSPSVKIWLPALRKVRRFSAPAHDDFWAGSVMTYGDVFLRRPEHEIHEISGMAKVDYCLETMTLSAEDQDKYHLDLPAASCEFIGRKIYRLKSTTRFENWWYDYHLSDVDTQTFAPYRTEYFKDGKSVKTVFVNWRAFGHPDPLALYPHYLYAKSTERDSESLFFIPKETISWETDLSDRFWSERTLRKIKR